MPFQQLGEVTHSRAMSQGAAPWIEGLPALVQDLEREWGMLAGSPLSGGSEAYVAEARLADGTRGILKVMLPRDDDTARHEATVLRVAGGEGCARLLREDMSRGAMLLERLGRPLAESGMPPDEQRRVLVAAAQRVWRPGQGLGLQTGEQKAQWLIEYIRATWDSLRRPCSEAAVAYAAACAERRARAHDDARAVLVHGDIHAWNALEAEDGYRLVDPDGLLAEAEYDLGVVVRGEVLEPGDPDPRALVRALAADTGTDATAIWEWAAVERVSSGLVMLTVGLDEEGERYLRSAEVAAEAG